MEVSDQFHILNTLSLGKESLVSTVQEAGYGGMENFLLLPGIKLQSSCP
jgi:hypothetical protein